MDDESDIADITLQFLAKAGEITLKEQSKMPSTVLASRLRSANSGPATSGGEPSSTSHHAPDSVLAGGSNARQATSEARGRQKQTTEIASNITTKQHADGASRGPAIPPQKAPTDIMSMLGPMPIRRAWKGRPERGSPDISRAPVAEAIMVHERGEIQTPENQCSKCRRGEGMTPECIKISGILNGACSNCLMARALSHPGPATRPIRSYSAERRSISAAMSPSVPKEDLIAVWNLIAGVISTQPRECFFDDGTEPPGKRIEDAARLVARSADEWGHTIQEEGPGGGKVPRTPSERSRLVRQATRIRETALQIASCARDWGERLEKKRSTSQQRS